MLYPFGPPTTIGFRGSMARTFHADPIPAPQPAPAPVVAPPVIPPVVTPPVAPPAGDQNQENAWRRKAEDAQKRITDFEAADQKRKDADLAEVDREKKRADTAEASHKELAAKLLKLEVVNAKKVPADAISLLTGTDEATLNAQADAILRLRTGAPAVPIVPAPPVSGGTITRPVVAGQTSVTEQIAAAYKSGNTTEAIRLKREVAGLGAPRS